VFIYLSKDGITGRGEAAPSERYGESVAQIEAVLRKGVTLPEIQSDPTSFQQAIRAASHGIHALEAALDMAVWDWWAQKQNKPLFQMFGVNPEKTLPTSFTIALGDFNILKQKIEEAEPYKILKIKLGTDKDREIVKEIRKYTDKTIRVDANEGWTTGQALEIIPWLADQGVELIEQPLPADQLAETKKVSAASPIPVIADENCITGNDIPIIADSFNGINIKLMKCGGLTEAYQMIKLAQHFGLKIMVGCMVESSVAITAMSNLISYIDFADLDGNLLVTNDPYQGVRLEDGKLALSHEPGLGLQLRDKFVGKDGLV